MEPGQYQLQIFISLIVILGAALVALICDFLKGNNEQLREIAIELHARQEEQRRTQMPATRSLEPAKPEHAARQAVTPKGGGEKVGKPSDAPVPRALAAPPGEKKRAPAREALAAMERGAQLAGAPVPVRAAAVSNVAEPRRQSAPAPVAVMQGNKAAAERKSELAPVAVQPVEVAVNPEVILGSAARAISSSNKRDWGSVLSRGAVAAKAGILQASSAGELVQSATATQIPAGFHDSYILSGLIQSRQPVSGLVVSVSVNSTRKADPTIFKGVQKLIQSLIGPEDFACQSNEQEFLLIYPRETGAAAQRHLNEIAQELWNFQLSSLGTRSIVFSWGGVEVRSESIDEAIASATERMQETRRGRKLLTMEARPNVALRQAV